MSSASGTDATVPKHVHGEESPEQAGRTLAKRAVKHRPPRFIVDAMLGSLARKLRIFGFDALYFREGNDAELEALARIDKRVILTSDRSLFKHSQGRGLKAILVEGRTDKARLLSVQAKSGFGVGSGQERLSRCAECNGELQLVARRDSAASGIPAKVLARHRLFYRCRSCSRSYWRGRHWERLRRLSYSLKTKDLTKTRRTGSADPRSGA